MPIYAYHCQQCGHQFDRLQKVSDPDPDTCPACAAHAVQRSITAPSFRLAGSGWYETDFKGKGETRHNIAGASEPAPAKPAESGGCAACSAPATEGG